MVIGTCDWVTSALFVVLSTRVRRRRKFGEVSCTDCTFQGNNFELVPTVKMETRNPVEGYFCSEFPAICNHCGVMTALSRKPVKMFEKFLRFFGKTTTYGKIFKILFQKFSSRHRLTCCVQISWNLADGKLMKSCAIYLIKKNKISPGSPAVATSQIATKICQSQFLTMYSECSRFHSNRFTFGGVTAKRENTAKTRRKVNPIFGWNLASSPIIIPMSRSWWPLW